MKSIAPEQKWKLMNSNKRYFNAARHRDSITGAVKDCNRRIIPEDSVLSKNTFRKQKRVFNTTGICYPSQHYMVSLEQRMRQKKALVYEVKYFMIKQAHQYGKSTILHALTDYLSQDYFVISMDFQMQMSDAKFRNENAFSLAFARAFITSSRANLI